MQVGGEFMWINSLEYMFPITANDMLRGVLFVDAGTVEEQVELKDYRVAQLRPPRQPRGPGSGAGRARLCDPHLAQERTILQYFQFFMSSHPPQRRRSDAARRRRIARAATHWAERRGRSAPLADRWARRARRALQPSRPKTSRPLEHRLCPCSSI